MNTARSSPYKPDRSENEGNRSSMRSPRYLEPIGHQKEVYPYSPSPNKRLERHKKHAFDSKVYWSTVNDNKKRTCSNDNTSTRQRVISAAGDEEGGSEGGEEYRSSNTSTHGGKLPSPRSLQRRAAHKDSVNADDDEKRWLSHRFMEFYTNTSLVKGDAKYPQGPLISPRSAHGLYVHVPNEKMHLFTSAPPRDELAGASPTIGTATSEGRSPSSPLHIPSPPRMGEVTRCEAGDGGHAREVSGDKTPSETEISAAGGSPRTKGENRLVREGEGECGNRRASEGATDGTNASAVVGGNEADIDVPPPSAPASATKVRLSAPHTPRKTRGRGELGGHLSPLRITSSQSNAISLPSSSSSFTGASANQACTHINLISPRVEEILRSLPSFDHSHVPPKPPPILEPKDPLQIIHGKGFELPPVKPTDTTRYKGKYRDGEPKKLGSSQPVGRVGEFR